LEKAPICGPATIALSLGSSANAAAELLTFAGAPGFGLRLALTGVFAGLRLALTGALAALTARGLTFRCGTAMDGTFASGLNAFGWLPLPAARTRLAGVEPNRELREAKLTCLARSRCQGMVDLVRDLLKKAVPPLLGIGTLVNTCLPPWTPDHVVCL